MLFHQNDVHRLEGYCSECGKSVVYKNRHSFNHHKRTKHDSVAKSVSSVSNSGKLIGPVFDCLDHFNSYYFLIEHLQTSHGIDCSTETRKFSSIEECDDYIAKLENDSNCAFVSRGGVKHDKNGTRKYKQCNRSGCYESKAPSSKYIRNKDSRNMRAHCPAYLRIKSTDESVMLKMCLTHVGHEMNIAFLNLPATLKNESVIFGG